MAAPDYTKESTKWFQYADQDKDGAIAGAEAVTFFQRSGLDTATLGQVGIRGHVRSWLLLSTHLTSPLAATDLGACFWWSSQAKPDTVRQCVAPGVTCPGALLPMPAVYADVN